MVKMMEMIDSLTNSMNASRMKSKKTFLAFFHKAFLNQELSSSQKLEIDIPLNTDMKIISKVLSLKIKNVLPFLISSNQTAYVKNGFISESEGIKQNSKQQTHPH